MVQVQSSDILGGGLFVVGVLVMADVIPGSPPVDPFVAGAVLMILGVGASFGASTFLAVLQKFIGGWTKKTKTEEAEDGEKQRARP